MKSLVILTVLFYIFAIANARFSLVKREASDSSSAEENLKDLAKSIKDKFNTTILLDFITLGEKVKTKCPDIEDKIETTMEKVGECLESIELGSDTFCSLIKKNTPKCAKPARELVESCLPEESKDLPIMVEKIMLSVVDQACHSTVEEMLELLNPCKFEKDPTTVEACKEVKTTVDEHKDKLPSKSLICQTLPKVRNCVKALVDGSCKNPITKDIHVKMHDAVDKVIKDECAVLNKV